MKEENGGKTNGVAAKKVVMVKDKRGKRRSRLGYSPSQGARR